MGWGGGGRKIDGGRGNERVRMRWGWVGGDGDGGRAKNRARIREMEECGQVCVCVCVRARVCVRACRQRQLMCECLCLCVCVCARAGDAHPEQAAAPQHHDGHGRGHDLVCQEGAAARHGAHGRSRAREHRTRLAHALRALCTSALACIILYTPNARMRSLARTHATALVRAEQARKEPLSHKCRQAGTHAGRQARTHAKARKRTHTRTSDACITTQTLIS